MNTKFNLSNEKFEQNSGSTLNLSGTTNFNTSNGGDLLIDGISIKSLTGSTASGTTSINVSNGLTKSGNTISFGGALNTDTNLDLNEKYLLIRNGSFYINDEIEEFEVITKTYNSLSSINVDGDISLSHITPDRLSLLTKHFDEDNSSFISLNNNASGGTVIGRSVYNELTNDFDNGRFIQFTDDATVLTGIEQNDSNSKILTLNDDNEIEWLDVNSIVVTGGTGSPLLQKQVTGTSYTIADEDNNYIIYFTHVSGCSIVLTNDVSENITFTSVRLGGVVTHTTGGTSNIVTVNNEFNIEVVNGAATWVKESSTNWFGWGALGVISGITNTASVHELMKSDGTNAVTSGIFSTTHGNINLGTDGTSLRTISATGSSDDVGLYLTTQGAGELILRADKSRVLSTTNGYGHLEFTFSSNTVMMAPDNAGSSTVNGCDVILAGGEGHQSTGNYSGGSVTIRSGLRRAAGSGADGDITLDGLTGNVRVKHSGDELFKINGLIDSIPHTGATLILTEKHRGKFIYFSNECEITIPDDLTFGFNCVLFQDSSGVISVVGDGATINGKTATTSQYESIAILYYKGDNIYSGI